MNVLKAKLFASKQTTEVLAETLRTLEGLLDTQPLPDDYRAYVLLRVAVIEELEARYPEADEAVERAFEVSGNFEEVDYVAVLLAAIPAKDLEGTS